MASPHTGVARPPLVAGVEQDAPSPPPGPGVAPIINIPADADPNNAATMFLQQYRALANQLAWVHSAMRIGSPIALASGNGGFSTVTKTGVAGAGTCTPSGRCHTGLYCVVKIMASGGLGVGTFQFSTDGGKTYTATATIPGGGVYTDASGVVVTFAGAFGATDTYHFHSAMTPLVVPVDFGGKARHYTDHNGFRMGWCHERQEDYMGHADGSSIGVTLTLLQASIFKSLLTGGSLEFETTPPATPWWRAPTMRLNSTTTNGNSAALISEGSIGRDLFADHGGVIVLEWAAALDAVGANNQTVFFGFGDTTNGVYFTKASGDTNWQAKTLLASVATTTNTNVAPVVTTPQRFRIEIHGGASPIGDALGSGSNGCALFWINESLVGIHTATLPVLDQRISFSCANTAGLGGLQRVYLSPIRYVQAMFDSVAL